MRNMFDSARKCLFSRARFLVGVMVACLFGCNTLGQPPANNAKRLTQAAMTNDTGKVIVRNLPNLKPSACEKLNPLFWFGNIDDPIPPDWYRPDNRMRTALWHFRNPMHNFFFYVIGIADKEFEIVGRYPGRISNPDGGWNWTVCKYKWLRLPFISYKRGNFNFYFGWRNRGNFGIKFNYSE